MKITRILPGSTLLMLLYSPLANGDAVVVAGSDYKQTQAGSFLTLGSLGKVFFVGNPIGPGLTDTIVQRTADAAIPGTTPLRITELSLESQTPVFFPTLGTLPFNLFVTLASNPSPTEDTGAMAILGTSVGGTFSSSFNVFFDVSAIPVGGGNSTFLGSFDVSLAGTGPWTSTPPPGAVLVSGTAGDLSANFHIGLNSTQANFFGDPELCNAGSSDCLIESIATNSPEPSLLLLLVPLLVFIFLRARSAAGLIH